MPISLKRRLDSPLRRRQRKRPQESETKLRQKRRRLNALPRKLKLSVGA